MKVTLIFALIFTTTYAAPQQNRLKFRNIYEANAPGAKLEPPIGGRIINGEVAKPHSIPYQVFLTVYSGWGGCYCGGTLLSVNYILTSGRCGYEAHYVDIVLGAQKPSRAEDSQVTITAAEITVHPDYDLTNTDYDIAVIKLAKLATLNNFIKIVTLPTLADVSNTFVGATGRVSGWGFTDEHGSELSEDLRYFDNPVLSNKDCNDVYDGNIKKYQVCLSSESSRLTCDGDSGGPLTTQIDNSTVQIGILSYSTEGCPAGYPSVFTRITSFLDWIAENTDVVIN